MAQENIPFGDTKQYLMNKYQAMFIDKLTRQDLDEFQFYIRNQYRSGTRMEPQFPVEIRTKTEVLFS